MKKSICIALPVLFILLFLTTAIVLIGIHRSSHTLQTEIKEIQLVDFPASETLKKRFKLSAETRKNIRDHAENYCMVILDCVLKNESQTVVCAWRCTKIALPEGQMVEVYPDKTPYEFESETIVPGEMRSARFLALVRKKDASEDELKEWFATADLTVKAKRLYK